MTTDSTSKLHAPLSRAILERQLEILQYESLTKEQQDEYLDYWHKKFKADLEEVRRQKMMETCPQEAKQRAMEELSTFDFITGWRFTRAYFPTNSRFRR